MKSGKNDANDAEAICEAASRPNMRYVALKTGEQQAGQALHRVRSRLVKARTALVNEIRGLLSEFGSIMPVKGVTACRRLLAEVLEDGENGLPGLMRRTLFQLSEELSQRSGEIGELDEAIKQQCKADPRIQRLLEIEGIGPISASAVVAAVGDARQFEGSRDLSAWVGLVPNQHSSGGKERLGGSEVCRSVIQRHAACPSASNRSSHPAKWGQASRICGIPIFSINLGPSNVSLYPVPMACKRTFGCVVSP